MMPLAPARFGTPPSAGFRWVIAEYELLLPEFSDDRGE
jgi:hypothetical protein